MNANLEIFKPVITKTDYTGFYEVSNHGKVKSLGREVLHLHSGYQTIEERILKPAIGSSGYYHVILYKNGSKETCKIHIIEWDAHSEIERNGFDIDHIDEDKLNNYFTNFQLLTQNTSKSRLYNGKKSSQYIGVTWNKQNKKGKLKLELIENLNILAYSLPSTKRI